MINKTAAGVAILVLLATGAFFLFRGKVPGMKLGGVSTPKTANGTSFSTPKKSLHWENNAPEHGAVLAGVPVNVSINFNFDLGLGSEISITKDSQEYGVGESTIDENKLTLRRKMNSDSPDGKYAVHYKACWPDGSCHDGMFEFAVDGSRADEFTDMTGKDEVTVSMENTSFNPRLLRVSRGTKVIWVNNEIAGHYVNTDPHAGHDYFPAQNSQLMGKGDIYSLVFDTPGIYPYHCSAHAAIMTAAILVE